MSKGFWIIINIFLFICGINGELSSGRIKGDDEPHLVTWRVLEGVTEPFGNIHNLYEKPAWKVMKEAADQKAASLMIQLALHEYGQLLRHPYMFGEMPMEERYDVFLSMAKLLKLMGFHQRAELLLYEAMAYTNQPYEANLQLGLLFLDKEDTEKAKMHFKNCLFFREADVLVLVHISSILIAESKVHEAKFFMSRLLTILEKKMFTLSSIIQNNKQVDIDSLSSRVEHSVLSRWLDDLMIKIFHGEFRMTPSSLVENFKMFSNLYSWLDDGEMIGRFVFDMGQSLYEGGKPKIGIMMMRRGFETSDPISEGIVSTELVAIRLALDFPVVPSSITDIIASYVNMTTYLSVTASSYTVIELENIIDIYWPLPLIWWSNIPVGPVINELLWRFDTSDNMFNIDSPWKEWLKYPLPLIYNSIEDKSNTFSFDFASLISNTKNNKKKMEKTNAHRERPVIEIGIFGGHMNNHPTGHMVLQRILNLGLASSLISPHVQHQGKSRFRFTLLALPLISDSITKHIASSVAHIINLPVDPNAAISIIEKLSLDIIFFPDWQPFPDQQAMLFQAQRFAPIQICFFVRGSSCVSNSIDYYILPRELENFYLNSSPAASINSTKENNNYAYYRPPWLEIFSEQVIMIDWPILTSKVIQSISKSIISDESANAHRKNVAGVNTQNSEKTNNDYDNTDPLKFLSLEIEGPIFFEGQPVAVIPIYPSYLHPIMDNAIVKLMHLVSSLQVVLVVSDNYLSHSKNVRHKLSWARQLVRRLWSHGDNLSQRIRLLPTAFNDGRLLKLFKQADMILDTFPIGLSFHFHAMALSVGTPIITLDSGIIPQTSKADLSEVKEYLNNKNNNIKFNPLYQHIVRNNMDIPWNPSLSSLSGFYERIGLKNLLVANSTSNYAQIASVIAIDKEIAYDIRIKLLEIVDEKFGYDFNKKVIDDLHEDNQNYEFSYNNITKFGNQLSTCKYGSCLEDLAIFLDKIGTPIAINRLDRLNIARSVSHSTGTTTTAGANNKKSKKSDELSNNNNVIGSLTTE
jgi:hypothetical protein